MIESIGVIIAAISALVGLATLVYKYVENKAKRPRLVANRSYGWLAYDGGQPRGPYMIFFHVANPVTSDRPITLAAIHLSFPDNQNMLFPELEGERSIPCELQPGKSARFWIEHRHVASSLRGSGYNGIVIATLIADDAEGKSYKGEEQVEIYVDEDYPGNFDEL